MEIERRPDLGSPAPETATLTAQKLSSFAIRHIDSITSKEKPASYLDLGCGNGFITQHVAAHFDSIVGVDVEPDRLAEFRARVNGDKRYRILENPSERLDLPSGHFDMVTCFEVLEHVENVSATASEIVRVLAVGGVLVVSVPQVLFPFENHGMQIGQRTFSRKIPLLPYVPPLHRRFSLARVFSSREVDTLFTTQGLDRLATGYAAPQFERAASQASSWESKFGFLRELLGALEEVPVLRRFVGVSMLKAYRKR